MRPPAVFIVDDEPSVADAMAEAVGKLPCDIHTFYDSKSVLAAMKTIPPAVLVTDYDMPGLNGLELSARLREITADAKVLLVSGHAPRAVDIKEGQDLTFFSKPVSMRVVVEQVKTWLTDCRPAAGE